MKYPPFLFATMTFSYSAEYENVVLVGVGLIFWGEVVALGKFAG